MALSELNRPEEFAKLAVCMFGGSSVQFPDRPRGISLHFKWSPAMHNGTWRSIIAFSACVAATFYHTDVTQSAQVTATFVRSGGFWNSPSNWDINIVPNDTAKTSFNCLLANAWVLLDLSPTIDNLVIGSNGRLTINDNTRLTIRCDVGCGAITNGGTISLASIGNNTDLIIDGGTATLSGGGTVLMGQNASSRILGLGAANLVNIDNTIRGAGNLGADSLVILNQGTIVADSTEALVIDPSAIPTFNNQGSLEAMGAGGITIGPGPFMSSGFITVAQGSRIDRTGSVTQIAGVTAVNGVLTASTAVDIKGGSLTGVGTVTSFVKNSGVVAPGPTTGVLTIIGPLTQSDTGEIAIEIGGPIAGANFDRLDVSGLATLDGRIRITLINGFAPEVDDTFTVMTFSSRSGSFANEIVPCAPGGRRLEVTVYDTEVIVSVVPNMAGDLTCDCQVTADDVSAFVQALLSPTEYSMEHPGCDALAADMNDDTLLDGADARGFINALLP